MYNVTTNMYKIIVVQKKSVELSIYDIIYVVLSCQSICYCSGQIVYLQQHICGNDPCYILLNMGARQHASPCNCATRGAPYVCRCVRAVYGGSCVRGAPRPLMVHGLIDLTVWLVVYTYLCTYTQPACLPERRYLNTYVHPDDQANTCILASYDPVHIHTHVGCTEPGVRSCQHATSFHTAIGPAWAMQIRAHALMACTQVITEAHTKVLKKSLIFNKNKYSPPGPAYPNKDEPGLRNIKFE